jgi:hypothetical protein
MSLFIFSNNSSSTAAAPVAPADTTITVQTGQGVLFAHPSAGQILAVTLEDVSGNIEVVYCTGITGDVLTVTRAQESTTAQSFASGSRVEARLTAGMLNSLLQKNGGDTLTGTTTLNGILTMLSGGSIRGGELSGVPVRGSPGETDNQFIVPSGGGPPTIGGSNVITAANILNNIPSGFDYAHTNMILMWNGSSGSIPAGWHLCDGTGGTPDLRDRFIVGAGTTYTLGSTGGSAVTVTGSTDPVGGLTLAAHALTVGELPKHTHSIKFGSTVVSGGSSSQAVQEIKGVPVTTGTQNVSQVEDSGGSNGGMTGAGHTHSFGGTLAHTHTYTLPPYYGLFYIMKT